MVSEKKLIGKNDHADFPKLGLEDIAIKIDTGAYTSSIHCYNIHIENNVLYCNFLDPEHPQYNDKEFKFTQFELKTIKSSNGISQERYLIKTNITLFGKTHQITLSLNNRQEMKFPVLLGRKFLNNKYLVDTQLENLSYNLKNNLSNS
ncbi:RimK/LysX family protein [Mesonia sp. K7]|uniref:ATP-dependent zinc protease family protein n=1 Tax=Mesonia sp. K7 TaxID=2218606 RepID=UPI000DA8A4A7|nr:RimK/LysX family protein [Mesonia sp. K7]PZD78481.1 peptidase [Mesonia sp. K7]